MTTNQEWATLLADAPKPEPIGIARVVGPAPNGATRPVLVVADDNHRYFVKAPRTDSPLIASTLISEQVAPRLARALGVPSAYVALANLSDDMIGDHDEMATMIPGIVHASHDITCCAPAHRNFPPLAARELAAALYHWLGADTGPRTTSFRGVLVDCGAVLPPLRALSPVPSTSHGFGRHLGDNYWSDRLGELEDAISDLVIATAVNAPHESWGITAEDRAELAAWLGRRRDYMLNALRAKTIGAAA